MDCKCSLSKKHTKTEPEMGNHFGSAIQIWSDIFQQNVNWFGCDAVVSNNGRNETNSDILRDFVVTKIGRISEMFFSLVDTECSDEMDLLVKVSSLSVLQYNTMHRGGRKSRQKW